MENNGTFSLENFRKTISQEHTRKTERDRIYEEQQRLKKEELHQRNVTDANMLLDNGYESDNMTLSKAEANRERLSRLLDDLETTKDLNLDSTKIKRLQQIRLRGAVAMLQGLRGSDSPEMKEIKNFARRLDEFLERERISKMTDELFDELDLNLQLLSTSCESYINNPKKRENSRKKVVRELFAAVRFQTDRIQIVRQQARNLAGGDKDYEIDMEYTLETYLGMDNAEKIREARKSAKAAKRQNNPHENIPDIAAKDVVGPAVKHNAELISDPSLLCPSAAALAKLFSEESGGVAKVLKAFSGRKRAAKAGEIVALMEELRSIPKDSVNVRLYNHGGTTYRLLQRRDNSVSILQEDKDHNLMEYQLPCSVPVLLDRLEMEMVRNQELYGDQNINDLLSGIDTDKLEEGSAERLQKRQVIGEYIKAKTGMELAAFESVPMDELLEIAKTASNMGLNKAEVKEIVRNAVKEHSADELKLVNTEQAQQTLRYHKESDKDRVKMPEKHDRWDELRPEQEKDWEYGEELMVNLFADMVADSSSYTADNETKEKTSPGEALRRRMGRHVEAIEVFLSKPEYVDKFIGKLPLPDVEIEKGKTLTEYVREEIAKITGSNLAEFIRSIPIGREAVLGTMFGGESLPLIYSMWKEDFEQLAAQLDDLVNTICEKVQDIVTDQVYTIFGKDGEDIKQERALKKQKLEKEKKEEEARIKKEEEERKKAEEEERRLANLSEEEREQEKREEQQKALNGFVNKLTGFFGFGDDDDEEDEKQEEQNKEEQKKEEEKKEEEKKAEEKRVFDEVFNEKDIDEEEKEEEKEKEEEDEEEEEEEEEKEEKKPKNLEEVMESLTKGKKGQGRFNKLILKNYFRDSSMMDKRAMMASMVRSVKPKQAYVMSDEEAVKAVRKKWGKTYCKDPDNLTDFDRKIMEVFKKDYAQIESSGSILGGMLKGAGPLLQKVMQGMPMEGVPDSLKMAIKDMKSNLLPIPEDYVKSVMNVIIDRSNGGIKKIEVERSLGAASVGQAFLCKIYGRKFKNGKEVVIKILRPDAKNHMEREKVLMRGYAQQTDKSGGMLETFEGQLAGYEKELDLTLESRNVDAGKIYEGQEKEVVSMGIDHTVEAGPGYMLAEKAEGITVDRYLEDIDKKIEQIRRQFFKSLGEGKGNEMTLDKKNSALLLKSNEELLKEIKRLEKRRDNVCKLCGIWVKEGMIKSGFYHADLHSGNMMITDEKVTVIDYGNAVQINEHQQKWISAMLAAASTGDVELFFQSFDSLLDGKEEEKFRAFYNDEKKRQLKEAFRDVLRMGDVTETGQRIMACFLKAQELGVKVPPAVYNFSQGQLRLMNTVDEMNGKIQSLKDTIRELGTMKNAGISANDSVNPLLLSAKKRDLAISQDLSRNGKDLIDQQIAELEGKTKEQLFKKMKDVDAKKKGALARFRNSIAADEVNVSVALDPAKATTFKPKAAAAFIRDGIKRIKEKYNINDEDCIDRKYEEKISYEQRLEEGKALIEQVLPLVSTAPSHIVLKAYMKGYYAQMWQDVANCRFEKMDEYIRYFEERLPLVFEVGAKLKEWEKAKEDGRSAKTLRRLEREFCDKYYQLKDMSEGDTTIFADVRKQMELDEEDPEEFRKEDEERRAELQGMFEDETDGEQLRAAYDKLRETQKALIRGEEQRDDIIMEEDDDAVVIDKKKTKADLEADKDKAMDGFMELYKKVGIRQLKRQRDLLYDENTTKVKSNSFLHVMGRVLSDPMLLVKTAWRVGGSVGWKIYRSESHAKSQLKLERELKRQKEEAEKRKQEEEREKAGEGKAKDDVKLPDPDDREYTDLAEKAYNLLIKYYEKLNRNVPNFFPQDELESVMKQILRAEKDKKRKKPFGVDDIILEQQEKKEDPNADLPEEDSDEWDKLLLRASELLKDYYLKKTGVEPIGVKHDECVQVMRQIAKAKKENRLFTTNDIVLEKQDEQEEKKEDVKEDLIKNEDEKEDIKEEDKKEEEKEDKKEEKKDKKARKKKGYYADMTDEEKEYHELWREAYDMIQKRLFSASEYRNPSDDEVKIQIDILKAEREKNKK